MPFPALVDRAVDREAAMRIFIALYLFRERRSDFKRLLSNSSIEKNEE